MANAIIEGRQGESFEAEEVAEVAAFLASQEYLTGQTIAIDGGMTMQ